MSKELIVYGSLYFDPKTDIGVIFEAYKSVHDYYLGWSVRNIFSWMSRPDWDDEVVRVLAHYGARVKETLIPGTRARFFNGSGDEGLEFTVGRRSGEYEFMDGYLLKVFPTPPPGKIIDGSSIVDLAGFDGVEIVRVFDSRRDELHETYLAGQGVRQSD